jgi:hypothetical protein
LAFLEHPAEGVRKLVDVPIGLDVTGRRDRRITEKFLDRSPEALELTLDEARRPGELTRGSLGSPSSESHPARYGIQLPRKARE